MRMIAGSREVCRSGTSLLEVRLVSSMALESSTMAVLRALRRLGPETANASQRLQISLQEVEPDLGLLPEGVLPMQAGPLTEARLMPCVRPLQDQRGTKFLAWLNAGVLRWQSGAGVAELLVDSEHCDDLAWMTCSIIGTALHLSGAVRGIHAAVVRWANANLLVAGPSGSGKTSLVLLLAGDGGTLLAEDYCYINVHGRVAPVSLRDFVTLRAGTWHWLQERLGAFLPPEFARSIAASGTAAEAYARGRVDQIRLPIRLLNCAGHPDGEPIPIHAVIFPRISPSGAHAKLTAITVEAADAMLWACSDERMSDWMKDLLAAPIPRNRMGLAGSPRCFTLDYGIGLRPDDLLHTLRRVVSYSPPARSSTNWGTV
jgi:hypothetical protein